MSANNLILYTTEDGNARITLHAVDGTVWLTQQQLAELFDTTKQNVGQHIKSILGEGELDTDATVKERFTVAREAARDVERRIKHYNLDIPRYVDTLEEEAEIDIAATEVEIERLGKKLADVRVNVKQHLKELCV